MRWGFLLAVAACGSEPEQIASSPAPPAPVDAPAPSVAPLEPTPQRPRPAIPSSPILILHGPDNADAVVSWGTAGASLRLWPTLDGTHEPVIVPGSPADVRLIATADGFFIAELDAIGQLSIVRMTREGGVIDQRVVPLERPVTQLVATDHAFIALTDDQHVIGLDERGDVQSTLSPDPGEPVEMLVARGEHAVAMIRADTNHLIARAIDTQLQWGLRSAKLAIAEPVTLSPDGTRVAGQGPIETVDVIVRDLATGRRIAPVRPPNLEQSFVILPDWLDNETLVVSNGEELWSWKLGHDAVKLAQHSTVLDTLVTSHGVITAATDSLQLWSGKQPRRLGYRFRAIHDLVPAGAGFIATDGSRVGRFDAAFHLTKQFALPASSEISILDARHVVAQNENAQTLVTLGKPEASIELETVGSRFLFDRGTGWGAVEDSNTELQFVHWNGKELSAIAHWTSDSQVAVTLSSGTALAQIATFEDDAHIKLEAIRAIDPSRLDGHFFKSSSRRIPRLDMTQQGDDHELVGALPAKKVRVTGPDGSIAELVGERLSLAAPDGTARWTRTARGATGIAWTDAGELVAYGTGVARIDLATGDFVGARCGWEFRLEPLIAPIAPTVAAFPATAEMCEAQ
ncbi:MAG TPA: hypothetical protein VGC41_25235 [Kofleriaceae bacterium]